MKGQLKITLNNFGEYELYLTNNSGDDCLVTLNQVELNKLFLQMDSVVTFGGELDMQFGEDEEKETTQVNE